MPAQLSLFDRDPERTPVVLSFGMGVDSTALLLRWLHDSSSRNFPLEDLVCLTAMTGDEFEDTRRLVETHLLPLLRQFRIRFVQIARGGPLEEDGVEILDDSREPAVLLMRGPFPLSRELLQVGTVPQVAHSKRHCTHHHKGFPLTVWTNREFEGRKVRRVIGYNADEQKRASRSEGYSTDTQPFEYPLIEWGWERKRCQQYIQEITGATWKKSCCVFCPFAAGKPDVLQRYRESPSEAADALFLEYVSLCFNPRMTLYAGKSLRSVLEKDGNAAALRLLEERLDSCGWAAYRVRRIVWAKGRVHRKTEKLSAGRRQAVDAGLLRLGAVAQDGTVRLHVTERGDGYPTREEMLVAAPAVVEDKCRPSFDQNWDKLAGGKTLFDTAS